jgi:hypothetical protein
MERAPPEMNQKGRHSTQIEFVHPTRLNDENSRAKLQNVKKIAPLFFMEKED